MDGDVAAHVYPFRAAASRRPLGGIPLECATRERLRLPEISLAEFRDIRDWTDHIEEHDDDNWITETDTNAPPYGCIGMR